MDFTQTNTQADKDGNWSITIPNDFGSGQHTAIIKDVASGGKGIVIFKNPEQPYLINRIEKVVPSEFFYATIFVFLVILLLLANYWVLNKKFKKNERYQNIKSYLRNIRKYIILCLVLLTILFIVGLAFNKNISWSSILHYQATKTQEKPLDVSGSVLDISSGKGINGLDLSVGNVSIHTSEGGFFSFNSLNSDSEIKITSPLLKKSLAKKVDGAKMDILFDYDMYDKLADIIDLESRGRVSDIYEKDLSTDIKVKIDEQSFIKNYQSIFSEQNILDQKIVIGKVELKQDWVSQYDVEQKNVIEIEVFSGGKSKTVGLHLNGTNWEMVM